MKILGHW